MISPPGYRELRVSRARALAAVEAVTWVREILDENGSLYEAAARAPAVLEMEGRAPVYAIPRPDAADEPAGSGSPGRWVVRRYHRGGAVASLLGDRHLHFGTPRPFLELEASLAVRARGVPSPRVVAGAVYRAGIFYRADLVTEYVEHSVDMADLLFGPQEARIGEEDGPDRTEALRAAGRLVAVLARAGVKHPDLNAGNILLAPDGDGVRALVLDLDRCRVGAPDRSIPVHPLVARLERSLRKIGTRTGRPLEPREWETLHKAVEEG